MGGRLGDESVCFPMGKLKNLKNLKSEHRSKQTGAPAFKRGISWCKSDGNMRFPIGEQKNLRQAVGMCVFPPEN